jgi:hypothetical protein
VKREPRGERDPQLPIATKRATKEVEGEEGEPYLIRGPLPPTAQGQERRRRREAEAARAVAAAVGGRGGAKARGEGGAHLPYMRASAAGKE